MLQPKKSKFRRQFRGKTRGVASRGTKIAFGDIALKTTENGWMTAREIEAARKKITFVTKRIGKYWTRILPDKPVTGKPVGVKMGGGKGDIDLYVAVVKRGTVLFELGGVPVDIAKDALLKASHKLSVKTVIIEK